ncbi:ERAD-associated E3 ubiquitin-protein ligase HRD1B-like [Fagus crenata]
MGSTSSQGSVGSGLAGENLSQHQARLRAAAAAASISEKSYVYPSTNTLVWSAGYAVIPQAPGANVNNGDRFGSNLNISDSQPEAQTKFFRHQIEVQ